MNSKDSRYDQRADNHSQGDYFEDDQDSEDGSDDSYEISQTFN